MDGYKAAAALKSCDTDLVPDFPSIAGTKPPCTARYLFSACDIAFYTNYLSLAKLLVNFWYRLKSASRRAFSNLQSQSCAHSPVRRQLTIVKLSSAQVSGSTSSCFHFTPHTDQRDEKNSATFKITLQCTQNHKAFVRLQGHLVLRHGL